MNRRLAILIGTLVTLLAVVAGVGGSYGLRRAVALPEGAAVAEITARPDESGGTTRPERTSATIRSKAQYVDGILRRNIFDASAIGRTGTGDGEGVMTDLDLKLVGTVVADPETFSSALIARKSGDTLARGYSLGDRVLDAEITKIEVDQVTLRRDTGAVEVLKLDADDDAPSGGSTASVESSGDGEAGIEAVSETKFVVERELVERYLSDLDSISRLGRAIPHRGADGEIDGYRISGIRRSSIGEQLGIKNGDVVHAVNGHPLTSMQGAMSAYSSLQSESGFTFEVTRRGQKTTLEYTIK